MGRLTLNMLLSFAQFEREVAAKIGAAIAAYAWLAGVISGIRETDCMAFVGKNG